jgi:hypothetical protein
VPDLAQPDWRYWQAAGQLAKGRAVSLESTPLATGRDVWHKKHHEQGEIPHSSIDAEAG